jgi:hypothetical protein
MRAFLFTGVASIITTACDGGQRAANLILEPGEWEFTQDRKITPPPSNIVSVDRDRYGNVWRIRKWIGSPNEGIYHSRACLTSRHAALVSAPFVLTEASPPDCDYKNISLAEGRIRGFYKCGSETVRVRGSFTATSYEVTTRRYKIGSDSSLESPDTLRVYENRISARRIGDCPYNPAEVGPPAG